jgi:hypothetical protein
MPAVAIEGTIAESPAGWMQTQAASTYTGATAGAMAVMRHRGTGPRWVKREGRVYYRRSDLDEWLAGDG